MRTLLLFSASLALLSCPAVADDGGSYSFIKTNAGKVYTNCRVFKTDPDGVIIAHQHGGAKLLFADLTAESRAALGYDAEKFAAYEKDRAEQKKQDREELWKYRCEVAKAQGAAYEAEARRLEVVAVQTMNGGGYGGYGGYGYGYGLDGFGGFGYGSGYDMGYGYGNGYGANCGYGFGNANGYGYGNNCGIGSGSFGYGNRYGYGIGGTRFGCNLGNRNGCSPLQNGYLTRAGAVYRNRTNCGTVPPLNVIGRTIPAPMRGPAPLGGTPGLGASTPSFGGPGR